MACINCNASELDDVRVYDGEEYCIECFEENFFPCDRCADIFNNDDLNGFNNSHYCDTCLDDVSFECHSCNHRHANDEMITSISDYLYCRNCYAGTFDQCYECSDDCYIDDLHEYDGNSYCEACYEQISGSRYIRNYSYTPVFQLFKETHENTVYLGMELEVECKKHDVRDTAEYFSEYLESIGLSEKFYFKHDGSLEEGFEIVAHPMTLQYRNRVNWKEFLDKLKSLGCTSYKNGRCGLHFHISRDSMTIREAAKMKSFFHTNAPVISKFSMRKDFHYCRFQDVSSNTVKYEMKFNTLEAPSERYGVINWHTGKPTYEIRVFRGTLDHERFTASAQFCDALVYFEKCHSFMTQSWGSFMKFISEQNRYSVLHKYLKRRGLETCAL